MSLNLSFLINSAKIVTDSTSCNIGDVTMQTINRNNLRFYCGADSTDTSGNQVSPTALVGGNSNVSAVFNDWPYASTCDHVIIKYSDGSHSYKEQSI